MIFVTVGTVSYPFFRMLLVVEALLKSGNSKETIVFQHGYTPARIKHKLLQNHTFLSHGLFVRYLKQSRIVVCHAGPATIYEALLSGKKPWVLPRSKQFGEHVNDHQVRFACFMAQKKHIDLLSGTNTQNIVPSGDAVKPVQPKKFPTRLTQYLEEILQKFQ